MINKNVVLNLILGKSDIKKEISEEEQFMIDIKDAIEEIEIAESVFNNVSDETLIEAAILKEEAAKRKFDYLIKIAKEKRKATINE